MNLLTQDPLKRPEQRCNSSGGSNDPPQPSHCQQHPQQHHKHKHTGEIKLLSDMEDTFCRRQQRQQVQRCRWRPSPELLLPRPLDSCREASLALTTLDTTTTRSGLTIPDGSSFFKNCSFRFHERHGSLIKLFNNNRTAERKRPFDEFNNGVVMTHRPLRWLDQTKFPLFHFLFKTFTTLSKGQRAV